MRNGVGVCTIALFLATGACADTNPAGPRAVLLSLPEAVVIALRENLDVAVERFAPVQAAAGVQSTEAEFDPRFTAGVVGSEQRQSAAHTELEGSEQPTTSSSDLTAGLTKKLALGTEVGITATAGKSETDSSYATLNPAYDAGLSATLHQPLLKGAGPAAATAPLRRARILVKQSDLTLRARVLDTVRNTEEGYWQCVTALEEKKVRLTALELAEQTLRETQALLEAGVKTRVDVLQAEAEVAGRDEELFSSDRNWHASLDRLGVLAGSTAADHTLLVPSDPLPAVAPYEAQVHDCFARALTNEPGFLARVESVRLQAIDVADARRGQLPGLDFDASAGYGGLGADSGAATEAMQSGDGYAWKAGLTLTVPWGMRSERARLMRARAGLSAAEAEVRLAEQDLYFRIRSACRSVNASAELVNLTALTRSLREQQSEQEQARYRAGLVSLRDTLASQVDLAAAQLQEIKARMQHVAAVIQLKRLDGTLLDRHGLAWQDIAPGSGTAGEHTP